MALFAFVSSILSEFMRSPRLSTVRANASLGLYRVLVKPQSSKNLDTCALSTTCAKVEQIRCQ